MFAARQLVYLSKTMGLVVALSDVNGETRALQKLASLDEHYAYCKSHPSIHEAWDLMSLSTGTPDHQLLPGFPNFTEYERLKFRPFLQSGLFRELKQELFQIVDLQ